MFPLKKNYSESNFWKFMLLCTILPSQSRIVKADCVSI